VNTAPVATRLPRSHPQPNFSGKENPLMKTALALLAVLAVAACTSSNDMTDVCATGAFRCDSSAPSQLQTCAVNSWTDNPECDVACEIKAAGEVVTSNHYSCTCLGPGLGSRCDSAQ
jgi:hypothetical protein